MLFLNGQDTLPPISSQSNSWRFAGRSVMPTTFFPVKVWQLWCGQWNQWNPQNLRLSQAWGDTWNNIKNSCFFFPGHAHHHHHHPPHPHPHPPQPQPQLNHNHNNQNNHTTTTTTYDHHHNKSILPSPAKRLAQQASATLCAYSHYLLPTLPFLPTNYHTTYYVLSI